MGYPTIGAEGKLVSWGSSNFYSDLFTRVNWSNCRLNITTDSHETTGLDVEAVTRIEGLKQWSMALSGEALLGSAVKTGSTGLVTFASGYALHVQSWELTLEAGVHDITAFDPAGVSWRSFRPDASSWSGSFTALVDSSTAVSGIGSAPASATFRYEDNTIDGTLSGDIIVTPFDVTVVRGSLNQYTFGFQGSGALTPAGTNSLFGTTVFGIPLWSAGGSAAGAIVMAALTGSRTFSGADSFWRRISVRCNVGEPIEVSVDVQGTGAMTPA